MAQQPRFFEKNRLDFGKTYVTLTASEANDLIGNVRDRNNNTAWITTSSTDASGTNIEVDFIDPVWIDFILLVKHNFKSYTVQYWNGSSYTDFSTAISETTNSDPTTFHEFTAVNTQKIKLVINGTFVADDDKYLFQFIATRSIGQFSGWPVINAARFGRERTVTKMLSGKVNVTYSVGAFSVKFDFKILSNSSDIAIVETLFGYSEAFMVWICGGDEAQFSSSREGYRLEDIFTVQLVNEWNRDFYNGRYYSGMKIDMDMVEAVN